MGAGVHAGISRMKMGQFVGFDFPLLQRVIPIPMQWCVVLIGLSIPISVGLDNFLLLLILLGTLVNPGAIWHSMQSNSVARATMQLFVIILLAIFYGATPFREAFAILGKYIDLMFVPIFIFLLSNEALRCKARYGFLFAMVITLAISYMVGLEILPVMSWMNIGAESGNPVIFHSHITQNNMMAFAAFLALLELRDAATTAKRLVWGLFALLATINVLFMVQGRTGYLILLILLGWVAWSSFARYRHKQGKTWGWRQGVFILLAFMAMATLAYHTSARLHDRLGLLVSEYQAWTPDHGKTTSTGQRLDFYYNSLQIVREHPLFGVGTGGLEAAFAQQTQGKDVLQTPNPHNEYLMITVQTGVVGLLLLLYLFYTQWRYAPFLPTSFEQDAARGLVLAYIVNCLFNSALLDHADGLFFAFMTAVLFAGLKKEIQHA